MCIRDSNKTNLQALEILARSWGMQTYTSENAERAFRILMQMAAQNEAIQICLSDSKMGNESGISLAARIRKEKAIASTPIVLMTTGERTAQVMTSLNVDRVLKPVKHSDLRTAFNEALEVDAPPTTVDVPLESKDDSPLRILVAEDNPVNLSLIHISEPTRPY